MTTSRLSFLSRAVLLTLLLASFIVSVFIIGYATDVGPWAYSDSTTYLWTAKNLASGKGLTIQDTQGNYAFLTWHPPLFPALLSLPVALGADALQSARWLNAILFGGLASIAVWATWRFSRSILLSAGTGLLILLSPDLIRVFSGAMSEASFLFFGFLGLFLLTEYLVSPNSRWRLIIAGLLISLAYLARYTGMAFIAAGFLGLLLLSPENWRNRLPALGLYTLSAGLLPAIWTVVVFIQTSTFGGRSTAVEISLVDGMREYIRNFWVTMTGWIPFINRGNHILPAQLKLALGVLILVVAIVILAWISKKKGKAAQLRLPRTWAVILSIFILCYLIVHIASFLFSSAAPDVDWRLLSPLLTALYLGLPMLFAAYAPLLKPEWLVNGLFLLASIITVWYFHGKTQEYLFSMHHYGIGYTSKRWNENPVFKHIELNDSRLMLLSNDPALILFHTGVYPGYVDLHELASEDQPVYPSEAIEIIVFIPQAEAQYGPEADRLRDWLKFHYAIKYEGSDGVIYRWETTP